MAGDRVLFPFLFRPGKQSRRVFFVEFEEEDHAVGFGGEGLCAIREIDGLVEIVVRLDERRRHRQRVVEIGERAIWKPGVGWRFG